MKSTEKHSMGISMFVGSQSKRWKEGQVPAFSHAFSRTRQHRSTNCPFSFYCSQYLKSITRTPSQTASVQEGILSTSRHRVVSSTLWYCYKVTWLMTRSVGSSKKEFVPSHKGFVSIFRKGKGVDRWWFLVTPPLPNPISVPSRKRYKIVLLYILAAW